MAHVVFLRGVNVGGHRTFRPAALAAELGALGAVNIGAAGTFVIRERVAAAELRRELTSRLPFETELAICPGRDIVRLTSAGPFAAEAPRPGEVRFLSVCLRPGHAGAVLPIRLPETGEWLLKVLTRQGRYVTGVYRRHMKVIGYLGALDRILGVPVTTRNWNTVVAAADVLLDRKASRRR
jgi:uncharacterized protein (DUF1697 family)